MLTLMTGISTTVMYVTLTLRMSKAYYTPVSLFDIEL